MAHVWCMLLVKQAGWSAGKAQCWPPCSSATLLPCTAHRPILMHNAPSLPVVLAERAAVSDSRAGPQLARLAARRLVCPLL